MAEIASDISSIDFSLKEVEERGVACCNKFTGEMVMFLCNFIKREALYYFSVEELIEELVTHELLGLVVDHGKYTDKQIDFWHQLLCRLVNVSANPKVKEFKDCSCPIECFWRDQYEDE